MVMMDEPEEFFCDIEVMETEDGHIRFWALTDAGDIELGVSAGQSLLCDLETAIQMVKIWDATKIVVMSTANLLGSLR